MRRWTLPLMVFALLLLFAGSVQAQEFYPYLEMNFDREVYHPGDTAIITINLNDAPVTMSSVTVELRYDADLFIPPALATETDLAAALAGSVFVNGGPPTTIVRHVPGGISISMTQPAGVTAGTGPLLTLHFPVKQYAPDRWQTYMWFDRVMPGLTQNGIVFLEPGVDPDTREEIMVQIPQGQHWWGSAVVFRGGDISGTVRLRDRFEATPDAPTNQGGVLVTLDGTDYSTTTDETGYFRLAHLSPGTYTLKFSKPGYLTVRVRDVPVSRGVERQVAPPLNVALTPGNIGNVTDLSWDAVFLEDLAFLARAIGSTMLAGSNTTFGTVFNNAADLDGDGNVGTSDLGLLATYWGMTGSENGSNPAPGVRLAFPPLDPAPTTLSLTLDKPALSYGDEVLMTATLSTSNTAITDLGNRLISFKLLTATGEVRWYSGATDASGLAQSRAHIDLGEGGYSMQASFVGDADLQAASVLQPITVTPETAMLHWHGQTEVEGAVQTLGVSLMQDEDGSYGNDSRGEVEFVITPVAGGASQTRVASMHNGIAQISISLENVPYLVSYRLLPNGYFVADPGSMIIRAKPGLAVADLNVNYSDPTHLQATISPAQAGREIHFDLDGMYVGTAVTDPAGVARLPYTMMLKPRSESYPVRARLIHDQYTVGSEQTGWMNVLRDPVSLSYTGTMTTLGPTDAEGLVTLTLQGRINQTDGTPGAIQVSDTIAFDVREASGSWADWRVVNLLPDGTASTTVKVQPGAYSVELSLNSELYVQVDELVVSITGPSVLTVGKISPAVYSDQLTVPVRLTFNGVNQGGQSVNLSVSGTNTTAVTAADGNAQLTIPQLMLPAGNYPYTISFAGDGTIPGAVTTGELQVAQEQATISGVSVTRHNNTSISMSANLAEVADGKPGDAALAGQLKFLLRHANSTTIVAGPFYAAPGQTVTSGPLQNVIYDVVVSLPDNPYYTADQVLKPVPVLTSLTVNALESGFVGSPVTVEASLTPPADGRVINFTVNGQPAGTGLTDWNGYVARPLMLPGAPGEATIGVSFDGDQTMSPASTTRTINVIPIPVMTLNVSPSPASIPADQMATAMVTATLQADGAPLSGQLVDLSIEGPDMYADYIDGNTDPNGNLTWQVGPFWTSGNYTIRASFSGTPGLYPAVSGTATLVVTDPPNVSVSLWASDGVTALAGPVQENTAIKIRVQSSVAGTASLGWSNSGDGTSGSLPTLSVSGGGSVDFDFTPATPGYYTFTASVGGVEGQAWLQVDGQAGGAIELWSVDVADSAGTSLGTSVVAGSANTYLRATFNTDLPTNATANMAVYVNPSAPIAVGSGTITGSTVTALWDTSGLAAGSYYVRVNIDGVVYESSSPISVVQ